MLNIEVLGTTLGGRTLLREHSPNFVCKIQDFWQKILDFENENPKLRISTFRLFWFTATQLPTKPRHRTVFSTYNSRKKTVLKTLPTPSYSTPVTAGPCTVSRFKRSLQNHEISCAASTSTMSRYLSCERRRQLSFCSGRVRLSKLSRLVAKETPTRLLR